MKFFPFIFIIALLIACSGSLENSSSKKDTPKTDTPKISVAIQPLGHFDNAMLDNIKNSVRKIYGFNVYILPEIPLPKSAFINVKSPRYRADTILDFLRDIKPDSINHIMGLTEKDISTTKYDKTGNIKQPESKYADWGIFGLGFRPGPSCIISNYRLKNSNQNLYIERLKKVCIHELGHNLGLPHCPTPHCVMQDADETIKTVDNEKLQLCEKCKNKLFLFH